MKPRTVLFLRLDHVLQVIVDVPDDATLVYFNSSSLGEVGVLAHLEDAILADFVYICEKEQGCIALKQLFSFTFSLVPSPRSRRDHLLLPAPTLNHHEGEESFLRAQVFPFLLRITLTMPTPVF